MDDTQTLKPDQTEEKEPSVVDTPESQTTPKDDQGADTSAVDSITNLETLINLNISKIDRLREEVKPVAEMITSLLEADLEYAELSEKTKAAGKEKGARRKELMQSQNGKALQDKFTKLKDELKDSQNALSDYLREYQQLTGSSEFEGSDGELRQIVYVAKLVRKTNLQRDKE